MKLTLGFSPCPNDTFIFDALVNQKIDTGNLQVEAVLEDVQTLNEWALEGKLDITKLSFPAFFQSLEHYILLHSGAALGKGVGPLLVKASSEELSETTVNKRLIVLPGQNTTANLLFCFAYPEARHKQFMRFDKIEDFVLDSPQRLGVIIHENRFTYHQKGLHKVADLGEVWEAKMKVPIPLGGIAIRRNLDRNIARQADALIRKSLEYAFANYPEIAGYVKAHSQTMSENVMRQHIDLYVNNFSLSLGEEGCGAVRTLYAVYRQMQGNTVSEADLFL